ncbi:MAG TPA: hypothetical protein VLI05_00755 [Candidatus Saccharimonadia bacterium]|nr:hypothetical protein [Candidatus Saccharimonadia bacterium]
MSRKPSWTSKLLGWLKQRDPKETIWAGALLALRVTGLFLAMLGLGAFLGLVVPSDPDFWSVAQRLRLFGQWLLAIWWLGLSADVLGTLMVLAGKAIVIGRENRRRRLEQQRQRQLRAEEERRLLEERARPYIVVYVEATPHARNLRLTLQHPITGQQVIQSIDRRRSHWQQLRPPISGLVTLAYFPEAQFAGRSRRVYLGDRTVLMSFVNDYFLPELEAAV